MWDQARFADDSYTPDAAETIQISSLALIKMLKHGRAGVPMEVMGLMLGEFVDDYTIKVSDVFAMPQSGTGVSVEAVDPVFQTKMMDMLKITGRGESVVGWYHSHPGFGCWLSSVDMNTQSGFEQLSKRAVAVVIDPIQSVKGKVVIDAFRLISMQKSITGVEARQVTSNIGYLNKPTLVSMLHGLNRHYYSLNIQYKKSELEENMLMSLHKKTWADCLKMDNVEKFTRQAQQKREMIKELGVAFAKRIEEEKAVAEESKEIESVGKVDVRRRILAEAERLMSENTMQHLITLVHKKIFH
ncbi:26S proteasome regulatory subunit N11 [Nematocida homosporus]|uniref:26S proteasome regulatory subunit N11 n=1 Tax=Nematocida homosporus TaxID=1912981 RepID=UPI00221EB1F7|nr:26S proteasome regulatory subunit N11 [Nematocida homosporus]KAI5187417.1 26S proteasome regulatory subunit N11 [Nematocida homosporus]